MRLGLNLWDLPMVPASHRWILIDIHIRKHHEFTNCLASSLLFMFRRQVLLVVCGLQRMLLRIEFVVRVSANPLVRFKCPVVLGLSLMVPMESATPSGSGRKDLKKFF